jgi:DNA replication protein DnaC
MRDLIRRMSIENPLWGAPKIHGELLKLGIDVDGLVLAEHGAELLFEIFSRRHERGSTVVTSNLPFEEWTTVFGSQRPLARSIFWS